MRWFLLWMGRVGGRSLVWAGWLTCLAWVVPAQAGVLNATLARVPSDSAVNLTQEGPVDWVHWGLYTQFDVNRKAGVVPQISEFTPLYNTNNSNAYVMVYQFNDHYNGFEWHDGTPTLEEFYTTTGVWAYGLPQIGTGFEITVPADTTVKTVKVYVGAYAARGKFTASLSDDSANPYENTSLFNIGNGEGGVYTVTFAAGQPGETLRVTWTLLTFNRPNGNVTLEAAALSAEGVNNPPAVALTAPTQNQQFTEGTSITLSASATDFDGQITGVEFYDGNTKVGMDPVFPYQITWNQPALGPHVLTARAADNQGAVTTSPPVDIFVHSAGGSLTGHLARLTNRPSPANLTLEGGLDWVHWGRQTNDMINRKAGVPAQIGSLMPLGAADVQRYTNSIPRFSWTDGAPTLNEPGTITGVFQNGLDSGFSLSLPASTEPRRVRVYAGLYGAHGEFQAWLSDYSAEGYSDSSVTNLYGDSDSVYTLDYQAASNGQSLEIRWRPRRVFDLLWGNVRVAAVALTTNGPAAPPQRVVLGNPERVGNIFRFSFPTELGRNYRVQQQTDLDLGAPWPIVTNVPGTGGTVTVEREVAGANRGFYRLLIE